MNATIDYIKTENKYRAGSWISCFGDISNSFRSEAQGPEIDPLGNHVFVKLLQARILVVWVCDLFIFNKCGYNFFDLDIICN